MVEDVFGVIMRWLLVEDAQGGFLFELLGNPFVRACLPPVYLSGIKLKE